MKDITFAKWLKVARLSKSLSQENLAKKTGISYCTINLIENGKTHPSHITIKLLSNFFKVPVGVLNEINENDKTKNLSK